MSKKIKQAVAVACIMTIGTGAFSVNAANLSKNVTAIYNNIKVTYNGASQTPQYEPFMIDGTVYVSLRDAGQITNNTVNWDGVNKTVQIVSKTPTVSVTEQELANKNLEIATLKSQLDAANKKIAYYEQLEEEKKEEESKKPDLSATGLKKMLTIIEDKYEDENAVEWEFDLTYDSKKEILNVTVAYNSKYDGTRFDRISSTKLTTMMKSICEDIQKELGALEIKGTLVDDYKDETFASFDLNAKGKFAYTLEISSSAIKDMEDDIFNLVKLPAIDYGLMKGVEVKIIDAEVEVLDGTVILKMYTDLPTDKRDNWNDFAGNANRLDKRILENFLKDTVEDFQSEYGGSEYSVIVYSGTERIIVKYEEGEMTLSSYR